MKLIVIIKFLKLFASAFFLIMLMNLSIEANAADIQNRIQGAGSYRDIVIEGKIEPGDFDKFIKMIRDNQARISTVWILSPGGDFDEAMKIGRAMKALELGSIAGPMLDSAGHLLCNGDMGTPKPKDPKNCTCASACFFIHIGGVSRGGTFLAVHRPYFEKGKFGELTEEEAKKEFDALQDRARNYMSEMGVPKHIQEDVLGTPSERTLVLDEKTVKTYFWGESPYRHEWLKNRCSSLSAEEESRAEGYSKRVDGIINPSDADLSKTEWADAIALQKKQDEEMKCVVSLNEQSRIGAYEKYFGVKPNDCLNYNFSKWIDAIRYLGKSYDEILSEEKFIEKKGVLGTTLERAATINGPAVILGDSTSKRNFVTWINLVSPPDPSQEFIERLNNTLQEAWGIPTSGNGLDEWLWTKGEFEAKLKHEPVSAEGAYFSLEIDDKSE